MNCSVPVSWSGGKHRRGCTRCSLSDGGSPGVISAILTGVSRVEMASGEKEYALRVCFVPHCDGPYKAVVIWWRQPGGC